MKSQCIVILTALAALGSATSALAGYQATVLADNPAGYWPMNVAPLTQSATNLGSAGSAANGAFGPYIKLAQSGAIAGDTNSSMYFIGGFNGNTATATRITVPYNAALNPKTSFSVEFWLKPEGLNGNAPAPILSRNSAGNGGYMFYLNGNTIQFIQMVGTSSTQQSIPSASLVPVAGQWIHVVGVYDSTAGGFGTQYLYTNGVLANSASLPLAFTNNASGSFNIGDRCFVGGLDEVAVYDIALSSSQVLADYQAGTSGQGNYAATVLSNSPAGYWRLGETGDYTASPPINGVNSGSLGSLDNGFFMPGATLSQPGPLNADTNTSAYFDGAHYFLAPAGFGANPAPPFSVECWAKPNALYSGTATYGVVVGNLNRNATTATVDSGWQLVQATNGWTLEMGSGGTLGTYTLRLNGTNILQTNVWYHLVGTYDGTTANLYVNGVVSVTGSTSSFTASYSPVTVGGTVSGNNSSTLASMFAGNVADVAIYPKVLTANQILADYQAGTNNVPNAYNSQVLANNPVSYWRLNDAVTAGTTSEPNLGFLGTNANGAIYGSLATTNNTPLVGDTNVATYFSGLTTKIDVPWNATLNTPVFSCECWFQEPASATNTSTASTSPMCSRYSAPGSLTGWTIYCGEDNTYNPAQRDIQLQEGMGGNWGSLTGGAYLYAPGAWTHLVATYDGSLFWVYLNGNVVSVSSNSTPFAPNVVNDGPLRIGAGTTENSGNFFFTGSIDQVAVYTNALSPARVLAHWVAARLTNPPPTAPTIYVQPQPASNYAGATVELSVLTLGSLPFYYQWQTNGMNVPNQTNSTLTLAPAQIGQTGNYTVIVTNAGGGTTSMVAYVEIDSAPPTTAGPLPATRLTGGNVTFEADASGSLPFLYQWLSNNVFITGATNATYTLTGIQASYAANYSVYVTNAGGAITSQIAPLTVVVAPPGSYAATVVADDPVAFWRLDETNGASVGIDDAGGFDGLYDPGMQLGLPGAILGDPDTSAYCPGYATMQVPYNVALNSSTAFSLECWAMPLSSNYSVLQPLIVSRSRVVNGNTFNYGYMLGINTDNNWHFDTGHQAGGRDLMPGGLVQPNVWSHIVATFENTTGNLNKNLYVNGVLVGQDSTPIDTYGSVGQGGSPQTDTALGGTDPADPYGILGYYSGGLDEAAIYNYVLSPAQVAAHYAVANGTPPTLNVALAGGSVVLTWNFGQLQATTNLAGNAWTNVSVSSPWTNAPANPQMFYRAVVSP